MIKGPVVFQGYFKDDERNKEAFDEDGWLHTGDVVEIWDNGAIKIIDRKKHLFKLSQAEYISPEKLENIYNKSPFIAQIFIDGNSLRSYIVGVIVPNEDYCKMWATKNNLHLEGDDLYKSDEFMNALLTDLEDKAVSAKLNSLEKLKKVHITRTPFSVENHLLTPSMKLVRYSAKAYFKEAIEKIYEEDDK